MIYFEKVARGKKVLVTGDAMLDKYILGVVDRISPEAPVPILTVDEHEVGLGGAVNEATNISALGVEVSFLGLFGDDAAADIC
jgi:bifunctional ADP-heptose synthase (sugar kinase/adenylyltransferase)